MSAARPRSQVARELAAAQRASLKASEARMAHPVGSSRARVTSLNAKWMRAAEHRDRLERELAEIDAAEAVPS